MRLYYLTTLVVEISCNYVPHFIGIWRKLLLLMPELEIKLKISTESVKKKTFILLREVKFLFF